MLARKLADFIDEHEGACEVYPAPFAVNLFADETTFVEPDVCVVCDPQKLSDRGCEGAPDFVAEVVSPSNPGMDYVAKLQLYKEAGVREYWICDPIRERVLVYDFQVEDLLSIYSFADAVPSSIFPGFTMVFSDVVGR